MLVDAKEQQRSVASELIVRDQFRRPTALHGESSREQRRELRRQIRGTLAAARDLRRNLQSLQRRRSKQAAHGCQQKLLGSRSCPKRRHPRLAEHGGESRKRLPRFLHFARRFRVGRRKRHARGQHIVKHEGSALQHASRCTSVTEVSPQRVEHFAEVIRRALGPGFRQQQLPSESGVTILCEAMDPFAALFCRDVTQGEDLWKLQADEPRDRMSISAKGVGKRARLIDIRRPREEGPHWQERTFSTHEPVRAAFREESSKSANRQRVDQTESFW
eukprot:scaffold7066_cov253-Pinguiococcus_pyrenoidosus.AAC.27